MLWYSHLWHCITAAAWLARIQSYAGHPLVHRLQPGDDARGHYAIEFMLLWFLLRYPLNSMLNFVLEKKQKVWIHPLENNIFDGVSAVLLLKKRPKNIYFQGGRTCSPFGGFLHWFYTCIFLSKAGPRTMRLCLKFISNIPLNAPHMKSRCARPRLAMIYPHLEGLNRTFLEIFSF